MLTWDGYPVPHVIDRKEAYHNPRRPNWPAAEFIVGNPPFIGGKDIRSRLGDAYAEAIWAGHKHINESADFVMYWWDRAAEELTTKGTSLRRFGFVTTNSITQEFSRRVMKKRIDGAPPISLVRAIPDHPWTKATPDTAAVRIAMTVAERGRHDGILAEVKSELGVDTDQPTIEFVTYSGRVNADLTVGVDLVGVIALRATEGLASRGMSLHGDGFIVTPEEAEHLGLGKRVGLEKQIRLYRNGRDLTSRPRGVMVIDLFGLQAEDVRRRFPEVYQHVKAEVKEKVIINKKGEKEFVGRDWNNRAAYRDHWWIFGEPRRELRSALEGLRRYIATVETTKHRSFQFLSPEILPDNMLVCVADEDAFALGILSSRIHCQWALRAGGWLGMGNDPRYSKSKIFDTYPFPSADDSLKAQIRSIAEDLDAFRKQRQQEHPSLTLTQMYNVLEKLKAIEAGQPESSLTPAEEDIKDKGLILILKELHERLDRLVFQAYGWPETLSDEEILEKLVALNHQRAAEERRGLVRWLRPEYQIPRFGKDIDKQAAQEEGTQIMADLGLPEAATRKPSFPTDAVAQTAAVFAALASASAPTDAPTVAARYRRTRNLERTVSSVLASLARLGYVATKDGKTFEIRRTA